jgi:hypothetical protein
MLADWAALNKSLEGRLIAAVPTFQPCYLGGNETECQLLQAQVTTNNAFVEGLPVQDLTPWWAGTQCPFVNGTLAPASRCSLGNSSMYNVNATVPEHVSLALQFVQQHNLRVAVKSCKHDFMGGCVASTISLGRPPVLTMP